MEWYVTDKASITASVQYRDSDNEQESNNDNTTVFRNRLDSETEDDRTIQYTLNYDKQFGEDTNHRLTFNFQYEETEEVENSIIKQDDDPRENVTTDERQDRIFMQSDYVLPIGEVSQLELGYQGRFLTLDTDYTVLLKNLDTGLFEF